MNDQTFTPRISLTQALTSPALFGRVFAAPSFWTWRAVAKLIDDLPLTEPRELELYRQCSGRTTMPSRQDKRLLRRFIVLAGRRAGKDRFFSAVAVWRAALCADWRKYLSPGEQAVVILLGRDKKQAAILRKYCHGLLEAKALQAEVKRQTADVIEFNNGAVLEIASNDASLVRGRSAIAVLGSECAHWKTDEHSVSSDEEVVGAAAPSMAMCPDGGLLFLGSSVYRRRGLMYRMYSELHGNEATDDVCWFAPSRVMNPLLRQKTIDAAIASDQHKANAEYMNVWREDTEDCFPVDAVDACIDRDVIERPPLPSLSYFAFFDLATGTGTDSFTLGIAHCDGDDVIIDVMRERKPRFVPQDAIREFSQLLATYRVNEVQGDKFADGYRDEWSRNNIRYKEAEFTKSEIYIHFLPMVLAQRVRMLDIPTLRTQLLALERKVTTGREVIDHPRHAAAHDDVANSCAGVAVIATRRGMDASYSWAVAGSPGYDANGNALPEEERRKQAEQAQPSLFLHPVLQGVAWLGYRPFCR